LGGIAKGYITDRLIDFFVERGVADAFVNLGGNVAVMGTNERGEAWSIGVRDPSDPSGASVVASVQTNAGSLVTSGLYERSFEKDGTLNLNFSSIELALHLADYIFDAQIWYFGKQIEDALEGTGITGNVRQNTKRVLAFGELPDTFTTEDVEKRLNVSQKTAWNILTQWQSNNYVKRIKKGTYIKLVKILV
jgi:hypothetical protein